MTREEHLAAIKQADREYYELDNPSMSDAEYDALRRSYIEQYGAEDLNYVPGNVSEGFESFKHPVPVTSLAKIKAGELDELHKWRLKLDEIAIEPKFDGLTVVAYPHNGKWMFVTRGSGVAGEILPNFISQYEQEDDWGGRYAIRGEVFLTRDAFNEIVADQEDRGEKPFKQIRNAASGILRSKDRSRYIDKLSYVCYDVLGLDMDETSKVKYIEHNTPFDSVDIFADFDIDTPDEYVEEQIKKCYKLYEDAGVPVDGVVLKSQMTGSLQKLGSTGHHNNNAVAWKPSRIEAITIIRDVIWQMGRGKVTPVAVFDPVELDDTVVTKASLHNADYIREKGIKIGAQVTIYKANEIIPQVGKVLQRGHTDIELEVCPACGGPLEEVNGQQFCTNPDCTERIAQNIAFLGKKDVLDINGLSIETARKLVDHWKKGHPGERFNQNIIFRTSVRDFEQLEGFGERSAFKIRQAIVRRQTNVELPRFIKALCIPGIGNDIGKKLADAYGSLDEMYKHLDPSRSATGYAELMAINGIGPVVAEKIACDDILWNAADELAKLVTIAPYQKEESIVVGEFVGKTFVLTGKMEHPRSYYEDLILGAGAKVGSSVNSKTDYLCIADVNSTSSKAKKARELGTKLISPEELEEMLELKLHY